MATMKELRIRAGLTQQAFSDVLGVTRECVGRWEINQNNAPEYACVILEKYIDNLFVLNEDTVTIKEARSLAKISQQKASDALGIPKRTIQDWEYGKRVPPKYIEKLVVNELLKIAEENKESA